MKILVSVLSGVIGILAALLVSGCALVQPEPGPWVLKNGAWCQANVPDCKQTVVKYPGAGADDVVTPYLMLPIPRTH